MEQETLIITLTDAPPIKIIREDWSVIAFAEGWQGEHEFQAFRKWWVRVRQHPDGRTIVYGNYKTDYNNETTLWAGELLQANGDLISAIHRVAEALRHPELAQECIQDLPTQKLE